MKKIFSFLAVALLALGFTACEDVPSPYEIEDEILGDGSKKLPFTQSFEKSLGGYKNYTLSGEGKWKYDHKAAVASGYNNADKTTTAGTYMLISPEINLTEVDSAHIALVYTLRYLQKQDDQKIMITKTFDENNPGENWTQLPATLEEVMTWEETRNVDLQIPDEFLGNKVRVALYYNTNNQRGSSWQVKSLSVLEGVANGEGGEVKPEEGVRELPYNETFSTDFGGFANFTTSGAGAWKIDFGTAKASGYDFEAKKNTAGTYYLVSPEISLAGQTEVHLTYEYIWAYANRCPNGNKLFITDNFNAENAAQNWTELPVQHKEASKNSEGKIDWKKFSKMDVQVPAEFLGKTVRISFYHECDDQGSTTMEIKNFKIEAGKAEGGNEPEVKPEGDAIFSAAMGNGLDGMTNYLGTSEWTWSFDSQYHCAKVSGHVGGKEGHKVAGVAYLVTPEISLENVTEAHIAYQSAIGYMSVPENHQMLINANFNEANPEEGWVVLQKNHEQGEKFFTWMGYDVQIPTEMMGKKVRVGFRYECSADKASTWELKDLKVLSGKAESGNEGGGNEGGDNEGGDTPDTGDIEASNGNFETWVDGLPNNWKSASTASSAKLSQSTDAHSGKFSVLVSGDPKSNKRLAYKELSLKAGDYTMKFFVKAATAEGGSARPAYVIVPESGKLNGDSYKYGDYVNDLSNTEWKEVVHSFTIEADGTFCMAIMNPKNPGKDILIDDFTLTDASGKAIIK